MIAASPAVGRLAADPAVGGAQRNSPRGRLPSAAAMKTLVPIVLGCALWASTFRTAGAQGPAAGAAAPASAALDWVWVEGETPTRSSVKRHPWWYEKVKSDQLSGGKMLAHFDEHTAGTAAYELTLKVAGKRRLWVRANPVRNRLEARVGPDRWQALGPNARMLEPSNIADNQAADLRFLAWIDGGEFDLPAGRLTVEFRMGREAKDGVQQHHGMLDCFVLAEPGFVPRGLDHPDRVAARRAEEARQEGEWVVFDPPADPFSAGNPIDLRPLNERFAGEHGRIVARDGRFVHEGTGQPVRFWGVNGPPGSVKTYEQSRAVARTLAKRGVNLLRIHGKLWDANLRPDPAAIERFSAVLDAMREEGIYTHASIYFPLWLSPGPDQLAGYDGKKHPFALLYFGDDFQSLYRAWWKALLEYRSPRSGRTLAQEPALFGVELVNEDSFFFWTFSEQNVPDPQLRVLEARFGRWCAQRHGSMERALAAWGGRPLKRDAVAEGRLAFRPLWNIVRQRTARDRDTVRFLAELQRGFYDDTTRYLRSLGYPGMVTASNWTTADARYLTPIEKWSYGGGDFLDRHGYFGGSHEGEHAAWSLRVGHTYRDRSAFRFEAPDAQAGPVFANPVVDPIYHAKPSMISETTFTRPNRFRGQAPLWYAVFASVQGGNAIVHFALDGADWNVQPNFFMQPWTLMAPTQMGQFPAAARLFRQGLVDQGQTMASLDVPLDDLLDLRGTDLAQEAALDKLREADVPGDGRHAPEAGPSAGIDPLLAYVGRTEVNFTTVRRGARVLDAGAWIDRPGRSLRASNGQVRLDWGRGLLMVDAPRCQAIAGDLSAGEAATQGLRLRSTMDNLHLLLVPLDDRPIDRSSRMLLQVMSEEQPSGWQAPRQADGTRRIDSLGRNPWQVRRVEGEVSLLRPDARSLRVAALDANGDAPREIGHADSIALEPGTLYYLITR